MFGDAAFIRAEISDIYFTYHGKRKNDLSDLTECQKCIRMLKAIIYVHKINESRRKYNETKVDIDMRNGTIPFLLCDLCLLPRASLYKYIV